MNGFREVGLAEMRQVEGGWGLSSLWNGVKKAASWTWGQLKKPAVGIPVAIGLGLLGAFFGGSSAPPTGPNGPYQPPNLYPR